MANEEIRRKFVRLPLNGQVPVDDITITLTELRPTTATISIEAPRDIPIGTIRRADGTPREASE